MSSSTVSSLPTSAAVSTTSKGKSKSSSSSKKLSSQVNDSTQSSTSGAVFWGTVFFAAIVFFFGGLLIGSAFASNHKSDTSVASAAIASAESPIHIGLPNTNNKIEKWTNGEPPLESNKNLRGSSAEQQQQQQQQLSVSKLNNVAKSNSNNPYKGKIITGIEQKNELSNSFHISSDSYAILPNSLDKPFILLAAWIFLDDLGSNDNDMRTIFSNKGSGCTVSSEQDGISLFVNAWQTHDSKLYVEYGNDKSGCNKLDSGDAHLIYPQQWYHVAVYLNDAIISLYINGEQVASSTTLGKHNVQSTKPMLIGQYDGHQFPLNGNISHLVVVQYDIAAENTEEITKLVIDTMNVNYANEVDGLLALYPFGDSNPATMTTTASGGGLVHDLLGHRHGKYSVPEKLQKTKISDLTYELIDGVASRVVTDEMKQESDRLGRIHAQDIIRGMQHAWQGYRTHAWGADELKPISGSQQNNWGGIGMTLVDTLDTLYLMGLKEEFNEAVSWVKNSLTFSRAGAVSVFETTIRALGGLLSAYDLSNERILLDKAIELGDLLLPAFETSTGIPRAMVDLRTHVATSSWTGDSAILSELGTLQIEFRYLAVKSKNLEYERKAMRPVQLMRRDHRGVGLYPIKISIRDGSFADSHITFGALGDSFYEYLLKVWLQGNKKEQWLRDMYDEAIDGVIKKLLDVSSPSGYLFIADLEGSSRKIRKMDHLVCFMPGIMALGAYHDPRGFDSSRAKRDLAIAKALMYTCRQMYHTTSSGIAPEYVEFPSGRDISVAGNAPFYILRPETAESLFVLGQITGDPIYRDWAYEIWTAIDSHCKTKYGYGPLRDVRNPNSGNDDRMESFYLAETLKYLYLSQVPETLVDLSKQVFNTEAHPMTIFSDDEHRPISE